MEMIIDYLNEPMGLSNGKFIVAGLFLILLNNLMNWLLKRIRI